MGDIYQNTNAMKTMSNRYGDGMLKIAMKVGIFARHGSPLRSTEYNAVSFGMINPVWIANLREESQPGFAVGSFPIE